MLWNTLHADTRYVSARCSSSHHQGSGLHHVSFLGGARTCGRGGTKATAEWGSSTKPRSTCTTAVSSTFSTCLQEQPPPLLTATSSTRPPRTAPRFPSGPVHPQQPSPIFSTPTLCFEASPTAAATLSASRFQRSQLPPRNTHPFLSLASSKRRLPPSDRTPFIGFRRQRLPRSLHDEYTKPGRSRSNVRRGSELGGKVS